ncbi:hypothetical protein EV401DRAFT_1895699 [Pisolithus croceorrhizus]|nr:hypothetical protein EV401DRAFT_1895699 [Pisolithus croceorrhizus]
MCMLWLVKWKAFAALGQWLNKKWTLCKSKKMLALESFHALHIEMQTLQEEWAAQGSKKPRVLNYWHIYLLSWRNLFRTTRAMWTSWKWNLSMIIILQQKVCCQKATKALQQKKSALGVSAQTDLYLLRNNKWLQAQTNAQALKIQTRECLQQHKFELECLEASESTTWCHSSSPNTYKGIFQLDVGSDIWQDAEPGEGSSESPHWFADGTVCKGIRLMLEVDQCNEEERRLSREWSVLQEWFTKEWQSPQKALEDTVYVDWEANVEHIPHAWVPSRNWGPTGEDVANCVTAASHDPSVIGGAEQPTDDLSEDYESDVVGALSESDDELLLGMEEMSLEGECIMGPM